MNDKVIPSIKPMSRLSELDFAKGVLIYLMVIFHIHYIGSLTLIMANISTAVYSFHMPAFLVLTGFLSNFDRPLKKQLMILFRGVFIPYLIFEFIYITLLYFVGKLGFKFSNSIDVYNVYYIARYLLLNPMGAYWYLHTFFIGLVAALSINKLFINKMSVIITSALIFWLLSFVIEGFLFSNAIFIILGMILQFYKVKIQGSWVAIIAMSVIFYFTLPTLDRFSLAGVALTFLSLSVLLSVNSLLGKYKSTIRIKNYFVYIGCNTLVIVLIHPIFINIFKIISKFLISVDHSGISYLLLTSIFTVTCCCVCAKLMDSVGLSKLLFGKKIYINII